MQGAENQNPEVIVRSSRFDLGGGLLMAGLFGSGAIWVPIRNLVIQDSPKLGYGILGTLFFWFMTWFFLRIAAKSNIIITLGSDRIVIHRPWQKYFPSKKNFRTRVFKYSELTEINIAEMFRGGRWWVLKRNNIELLRFPLICNVFRSHQDVRNHLSVVQSGVNFIE